MNRTDCSSYGRSQHGNGLRKTHVKLSAEFHAVQGISIYTFCVSILCALALVPLNEGNEWHDTECRIINIMENSIKLCDNSENHFLTLQWKFVRILFSVFWFNSFGRRLHHSFFRPLLCCDATCDAQLRAGEIDI